MTTEFDKVCNLLSKSGLIKHFKSVCITDKHIDLSAQKFSVTIESTDENWYNMFGLVSVIETRNNKQNDLGIFSAEGCIDIITGLLNK